MAIVHKAALLNYSAKQLYALVERIEDYPGFIPWCSEVEVQRDKQGRHVIATMTINFRGIKQKFSTININEDSRQIHIHLLKGPLKKLEAKWSFTSLSDSSCRVEFYIDYEFITPFIARMVSPFFDMICNAVVNAFIQKAKTTYQ